MATDAQRRAVQAYQQRQDAFTVRPSAATGAAIRAAAGQSVQRYILDAVAARMAAESKAESPKD